jgi:ribosomal protein L11 methyltransferase
VPYRILVPSGGRSQDLDQLVELGALDLELTEDGGFAVLMPDRVTPAQAADLLGVDDLTVAPAVPRDSGSVWMLSPRPLHIGRLRIVPDGPHAEPGGLRLIDGAAFGTGFHPTTALCLQFLDEIVGDGSPDAVLDVGIGSGILALSALMLGVPHAVGIDLDEIALSVSARNADLNGLRDRLRLVRGGPEGLAGAWPLVLANVLAAPLMEMAPSLVRRVGRHGQLMLSGIPASLEGDVERIYRRLGMLRARVATRAGWVALLLRASW